MVQFEQEKLGQVEPKQHLLLEHLEFLVFWKKSVDNKVVRDLDILKREMRLLSQGLVQFLDFSMMMAHSRVVQNLGIFLFKLDFFSLHLFSLLSLEVEPSPFLWLGQLLEFCESQKLVGSSKVQIQGIHTLVFKQEKLLGLVGPKQHLLLGHLEFLEFWKRLVDNKEVHDLGILKKVFEQTYQNDDVQV
jgi:hypothetical protein